MISVDFDGTIHDNEHPIPGRKMGAPMPGAKEALTELIKRGEVEIFSTWGDKPKAIEDWMRYYQIPFTRVTNIKHSAEYYIDNKAIHFTNWTEVMHTLGFNNRRVV